MFGSVTRRKIWKPEAPSTRAASSSSVPAACISGISSRATNGNVTKSVASTSPGTENTSFRPCASAHGPSTPCRPKSRMNTIPEMTGDTPKGRSISVTSAFLPGKSNFAIAHAAATPKTRFSGTAIAAVSSVSRSAESAIGSTSASTYAAAPLSSACTKTATSGTTRNRPMKPTAMAVRISFTAAGSPVARVAARVRVGSDVAAVAIPTPKRRGACSTTAGG